MQLLAEPFKVKASKVSFLAYSQLVLASRHLFDLRGLIDLFDMEHVMFFRYRELKKVLYIGQTLLGLLFLALGWFQLEASLNVAEGILNFIVSMTLLAAGFLCVLFGLDAYLLRGETDIWN